MNEDLLARIAKLEEQMQIMINTHRNYYEGCDFTKACECERCFALNVWTPSHPGMRQDSDHIRRAWNAWKLEKHEP